MELQELLLAELEIHPNKERWLQSRHFKRLAYSIQDQGLLTPLIVLKTEHNGYQILAGAHRMRALEMLQIKSAPCVIVPSVDDEKVDVLRHILHLEGVQRSINALQEGQLLCDLHDLGYSQGKLAKIVNRSPSWVQHRMALVVSLSQDVQDLLAKNTLSPRKAQSIARLPIEKQAAFTWKVITDHISAKDVDALVALFHHKNTNESLKESILTNPLFALNGTKKKSIKGVENDVRSMCFSLEEMMVTLENIKCLLINRKELTGVERRELKKVFKNTERIFGEVQSLIAGSGRTSSKEV